MKRDFDLIREILLQIQAAPVSQVISSFELDDRGEVEIFEHVKLLLEKGLVKGNSRNSGTGLGGGAFAITGLTWEGYDFIESAMSDTAWKKALTLIKEKGGALTFDILKGVLASLAKGTLDLS